MGRAERHRRTARRRARRRQARRSGGGGSAVLSALTAGALALPGLGGDAHADGPVERIAADYGFGFYFEDALPSGKLAAGSRDRYEIQMHQFHVESPLTARSDLSVDVVYESMSGASPWYVTNAGGEPLQVMSGATIQEERTDAVATGSYYFDRGAASLQTGISTENDYFSWNAGGSGELHLRDKTTTVSGGLGLSLDRIEPTDASLFATRVEDARKQSYSAFAGIAQVIRRNIAVQSTATYRYHRGFLADPYKQVEIGGDPNNPDRRPGERHQLSWLTRYRHHVSPLDGTLHADYRFYLDDWSIRSHTFELAWHQSLGDAIRLIPSLRYYSQSQAEFYGPFFAAGEDPNADHSSDFRLAPYGALSFRVQAETRIRGWPGRLDWIASVGWERYWSDGDLALGRVATESPGLVSFNLITLRLQGRF